MDVALYRGYDYAVAPLVRPAAFCCSVEIWLEYSHRLLHHAGRLHHLREEHLALTEEYADLLHSLHKRSGDDFSRLSQTLQLSEHFLTQPL